MIKDKLQTCLIFYAKRKIDFKEHFVPPESLKELDIVFIKSLHAIFILSLYCFCDICTLSSGKKPRFSFSSQRYRWVVSLFSIVIPWCVRSFRGYVVTCPPSSSAGAVDIYHVIYNLRVEGDKIGRACL